MLKRVKLCRGRPSRHDTTRDEWREKGKNTVDGLTSIDASQTLPPRLLVPAWPDRFTGLIFVGCIAYGGFENIIR